MLSSLVVKGLKENNQVQRAPMNSILHVEVISLVSGDDVSNRDKRKEVKEGLPWARGINNEALLQCTV